MKQVSIPLWCNYDRYGVLTGDNRKSVSIPLWCNYDSLILEMIGIDSLGIMEQIESVFDGFSRRGVIIGFCGEVDGWIGRRGLG